ncbi:MAG: carbohydrate kinase family protein [Candidatus Colwellbacteria bacterium]|nr:carbohydrate kinase family protein [Candidatus Colwellbacteria bacterium]
MFDVIAIGSTTHDSFFKTDFKTIDWNTPSKKAMILPLGEKIGVEEVFSTSGGNAANAAVTFARHKLKIALFTRVGIDPLSEEVIKFLRGEKINVKFVARSEKLPGARSVLFLQDGERTIISHHGAIDEFSEHDINFSELDSKWLYMSFPGNSYKMCTRLLNHANKNKILTALNPSYKQLTEGKSELLKNLPKLDVLFVNDGEAATLVDVPFTHHKAVFRRIDELMSPGIVVVTLGKKGVMVSDGKQIYKAGVFPEREVADRTGAGDAFGSGFIAGLIDAAKKSGSDEFTPENIKHAITFASANATSVVEYVGATPGILRKDDFEKSSRWKEFKIEINDA